MDIYFFNVCLHLNRMLIVAGETKDTKHPLDNPNSLHDWAPSYETNWKLDFRAEPVLTGVLSALTSRRSCGFLPILSGEDGRRHVVPSVESITGVYASPAKPALADVLPAPTSLKNRLSAKFDRKTNAAMMCRWSFY